MKHKVFWNEGGYIENVYIGDLKYEELQEMFKMTYEIGFKLQDKQQPVRILSDVSAIEKVPLATIRDLAVLGLKSFPIQKLAVIGARAEIRVMAQLILTLAGKKNILSFFKSRSEALAWLLGTQRERVYAQK